jgi:hypothetical protein
MTDEQCIAQMAAAIWAARDTLDYWKPWRMRAKFTES